MESLYIYRYNGTLELSQTVANQSDEHAHLGRCTDDQPIDLPRRFLTTLTVFELALSVT